MGWTPGRRAEERALEAPFEDVPDHLRRPLWEWIESGFEGDGYGSGYNYARMSEVAIHLRIELPRGSGHEQLRRFAALSADDHFMLDLVEALLNLYGWDSRRGDWLSALLDSANSIYRVNEDCDGLEMRVAPGVRESVQEVVKSATGSAGDHLAAAWNRAYGRDHDAVKSYSESIKASEAALAHHVSPQNSKQTLGTMIRDIAAKPGKWEFEIDDGSSRNVEMVLNMMKVLWDGQTSRHGGVNPTRDETIDEARAAVHLAAALVQFGVSGAFRLK